ncbi:hypothetical protein [Thalassoglobus sp.]|uniref:hypothetical protein n=1 Tax=Thalassoglobus sp. TaxID=2795869 RepID=UPI003AA975AD
MEKSPLNDGAGKRNRRQPSGIKQLKKATLLENDFGTQTQDGKTVNVSISGTDPTKYLLASTNYAEGLYTAGQQVIIGKIGNGWEVLTVGIVRCHFTMTGNMNTNIFGGNDTGQATLGSTPTAPNTISDSVTSPEGWRGLKTGHTGWCQWAGTRWMVTSIEDEWLSGTYDDGASTTLGDLDYPVSNPLSWNLLDNVPIYCHFRDGYYKIISAGCA